MYSIDAKCTLLALLKRHTVCRQYLQATVSCDAHNHVITFMLILCAVGAIPLTVIVTKGPFFNDYKFGYELAHRCFGDDGFDGQQFPKIFMTDDSEAEGQALKTI